MTPKRSAHASAASTPHSAMPNTGRAVPSRHTCRPGSLKQAMTKASEALSVSTSRRNGSTTLSTSTWFSIPNGPSASVEQTISGPLSNRIGCSASSSPRVTASFEFGLTTRMRGRASLMVGSNSLRDADSIEQRRPSAEQAIASQSRERPGTTSQPAGQSVIAGQPHGPATTTAARRMTAGMGSMKISEGTTGVFVIAATPFSERGELDLDSTDRLVDFYLSSGVAGITILGMMGEASKLTVDETSRFMRRALARVDGRVPIVVGVSNPGIAPLVELARQAMDAGAAGVMITPVSTLRTEEQTVNYFEHLCAMLGPDVPVVLQDYPQATNVHLSVATIERIVDRCRQIVML